MAEIFPWAGSCFSSWAHPVLHFSFTPFRQLFIHQGCGATFYLFLWCCPAPSSGPCIWQELVNICWNVCEIIGVSMVAETVKNLPVMQETQVPSLGREDPLEERMATYSSILVWRIHGQRNLAGYSPWVTNNPVSPLLPETQITHISVSKSVPSTVLLC